MSRLSFLFALPLAMLATHGACSEDKPFELSGLIAGEAARASWTAAGPDHQLAGARVRLTAKASKGAWQAQAQADVHTNEAFSGGFVADRVREAWLRYSGSETEWTIGRQFLPGGNTDILPQQDLLAPKNLKQLAFSDEDQILTMPAVRWDWYVNDRLTATAALVRQNRSYVLAGAQVTALSLSGDLRSNPETAGLFRLGWRQGPVEFAGTYAEGARPVSGFALTPTGIRQLNMRTRMFTMQGSYSLDVGILRAEVCSYRTDAGAVPGYSKGPASFSLGFERGLWSDATMSLQYVDRRDSFADESAPDSPEMTQLRWVNRSLSQAFQRHQYWWTAIVNQRVGSDLQWETVLLSGNMGQRALVQRLTWQIQDEASLRLRAQWAEGESDTLIMSTTPRRLLMMELRRQY